MSGPTPSGERGSIELPETQPPLIDWTRVGRRVGVTAVVLLTAAVAAWLVTGWLGGGPQLRDLWGWTGLALAGMFLAEVWVVGGAALRAMLRAGERGERLAGGDVGILPPQLTRRRRGRGRDGNRGRADRGREDGGGDRTSG